MYILTNIHRHSGGAVAKVVISRINHDLRVEVRDEGKGISTDKQWEMEIPGRAGVGIRGMRERIRQLAGNLEISSPVNAKGTILIARLPVDRGPDKKQIAFVDTGPENPASASLAKAWVSPLKGWRTVRSPAAHEERLR